MNYKRVDHIYICIPEGKEHEAHRFYTEVLGFEPATRAIELNASVGYWYNVAGIELHIGTDKGAVNPRQHFALEVDDIKAFRAHLEAHNVKFKEEIPIAGRERFSFYDPFTNRIELIQYLFNS